MFGADITGVIGAGDELCPNGLLDVAGMGAPKLDMLDAGAGEPLTPELPRGMGPDDPKLKDGAVGAAVLGVIAVNPGAVVVEPLVPGVIVPKIGALDGALPNGLDEAA